MEAVIVSWAKDETFRRMTQKAIDSAIESGVNRIVVIESQPSVSYLGANTIPYVGEFNYNKALNIGISHCKEECIALCNNDVIFYEGFSKAESIMKEHDIHSASPCRKGELLGVVSRMGYRVRKEMRGWCIILDRYVLDKIGSLDETYTFHASENIYRDQLREKGIEHHLLDGVYLDHLKSKTIETMPHDEKIKMTLHNKRKYKMRKIKQHEKRFTAKKTKSRRDGRGLRVPSRKRR